MSELSRRKFLHASAAVGAAAVVGVPAVRAVASSSSSDDVSSSYGKDNNNDHGSPKGSFIVYVKDARKGQISVLNGENETVRNDPDLVRRIVRAAG
jgi:hypothetical protein